MILKCESVIPKEKQNLPKEQLELLKRITQQKLATKLGETMLKTGLIEMEEFTEPDQSEIRIRASTVALNPAQLSYIYSMLCIEPTKALIMNELKNK